MAFERICVMGLGYIGLPTASVLATKGMTVHGVDVNPEAVDKVNRGELHIYEPALDVMVRAAVNSGNLKAALEPIEADVFVIAVPTPLAEGNQPEMSYVEQATRSLAPYVRPGNLVILESTSPIGATESVVGWLTEERPDLRLPNRGAPSGPSGYGDEQVYVAHCPERVLPGQILKELVDNDRIIGGVDRPSTEKAVSLYRSFVAGQILPTDSRTAEMAKLTENAYRDVNIAFANELSLLCDSFDIDVWELINLANRHPRVDILKPGPGVGGHCIAVDPWFIVACEPKLARLIRTAREVNDSKPHHVVEKVKARAERFRDPVIACLGLAFKADVDDLRESPSVEIVERLASSQAGRIVAADPHISHLPDSLTRLGVELLEGQAAIAQADIIVLLVDHREFAHLDYHAFQDKVIIDTRGVWR